MLVEVVMALLLRIYILYFLLIIIEVAQKAMLSGLNLKLPVQLNYYLQHTNI